MREVGRRLRRRPLPSVCRWVEISQGAARVSPLGPDLGCGVPGPTAVGTERWRSDHRERVAIAPLERGESETIIIPRLERALVLCCVRDGAWRKQGAGQSQRRSHPRQ